MRWQYETQTSPLSLSGLNRNGIPDAIAAYIGEVNALLADSTLLICSDPDLNSAFERSGRLEDNLWWIDMTNVRDGGKSLTDNLRAYQAIMEAAVSNRPAVSYVPAPGMTQQQAAKEDVTWYDLTDVNMEAVFS